MVTACISHVVGRKQDTRQSYLASIANEVVQGIQQCAKTIQTDELYVEDSRRTLTEPIGEMYW